MKTITVKNNTIQLDDDIYELYKDSKIYILNSRGKKFVRVLINGVQHSLHRLILNYPKNRILFKDGNSFNIQKNNLQIIDDEYQQKQKHIYYLNNKKQICERIKLWSKNNREKIKNNRERYTKTSSYKKSRKKYRQKEDIKEKYNQYYKSKKRELNYRYVNAKNKAKNKNLSFDLTLEYYIEIINKPCYYCETSLFNEYGIGLDRIDNKEGYILQNILPCCGSCNKTRGDRYTVDETKIMIQALLQYRESK